MKKICFCGFWAFYYHQSSVLTFISCTAHSVGLAIMEPFMCPIMTHLVISAS